MIEDDYEMHRPLYSIAGWNGREELATIHAINDTAGFVTIASF